MGTQPLVILDKNFLQAEDESTPRLRALARCGCEFVLIDTLIYELCSDDHIPTLWQSVQKKLFPFADRLHLWFHTSELLRREVAANKPVVGPEDEFATQNLRDWFQSERVCVPTNLKKIVEEARQQREVDSMETVAPMARAVGKMIADSGRSVGVQQFSKNDLAGHIRDNMTDDRPIRWALRACYGNSELTENYIPDAENRVNASWFAFHDVRATLALIGVFLKKYGLSADTPGKKFPNTKLDMDYLVVLHYADALASDETSGDMAEMCEWLYGSSKKRFSWNKIRTLIPTEDDVRLSAYWLWDGHGRTHGYDVEDWLHAETDMYEETWRKL